MKKVPVGMLVFWTATFFFLEAVIDLVFMHTDKGLWHLLLIAVLQALPYLVYNSDAKESKWKMTIIIGIEVIILIILFSFVLGMITIPKMRVAKRIIPVGVRIGTQIVMIVTARKSCI
ncbi:MAG: hypothetical protein HFJ28_02170 [Clostridia bacterium]|jgi:hypothetical protein|nr:hypothetical protein [Clostridia bacterium]